jgi:hypothetical protein
MESEADSGIYFALENITVYAPVILRDSLVSTLMFPMGCIYRGGEFELIGSGFSVINIKGILTAVVEVRSTWYGLTGFIRADDFSLLTSSST